MVLWNIKLQNDLKAVGNLWKSFCKAATHLFSREWKYCTCMCCKESEVFPFSLSIQLMFASRVVLKESGVAVSTHKCVDQIRARLQTPLQSCWQHQTHSSERQTPGESKCWWRSSHWSVMYLIYVILKVLRNNLETTTSTKACRRVHPLLWNVLFGTCHDSENEKRSEWNSSSANPSSDPRKPGSSAAKQAKTNVFLGFTWQSIKQHQCYLPSISSSHVTFQKLNQTTPKALPHSASKCQSLCSAPYIFIWYF